MIDFIDRLILATLFKALSSMFIYLRGEIGLIN